MTRGVARALWPWALAVAAGVGGCTGVNTSPTHVAALQFDALPSPAVVAGDTLRDSLGLAAPLGAIAFNGSGAPIPDAPIQYIALDTGVTIGPGGFLVAQLRSGSVRLLASAGGIETRPITLLVARRPDSVAFAGASRDTVDYVLPDNPATNVSMELAARVVTFDTAGGVTRTQGWRVSYQAIFRGAPVPPGDTTAVFLLGSGTQRSQVDTTGTDGVASRRLRVRPIGITQSAVDSVAVLASVTYRGVPVRGSPLRFLVLLRPKQ
jgi:hypothetical protein